MNEYFRKNSKIIFLFLLVGCLVFVILVSRFGDFVSLLITSEYDGRTQDQQEEYVVARQPISKGSEVSLASITYFNFPTSESSPDFITDKTQVVGKIAKVDILPGQVILSQMLIDPLEWAMVSSIVVIDNMVYFWDIDGHLYAVDTEAGQKVWSFDTKSLFYSPIVVAEDTLYCSILQEKNLRL
jgi:hypothetical protein